MLKQPLDRITEAYYDVMGKEFGRKVRERIHWVCSQAKGDKILDVGCSQGITSIILGREGKKTLGIDLIDESIDYAKKSLEDESEITKKYVEFKTANFMDYNFGEETYDSIILSEVLEHLTDSGRFLEKASKLINKNGSVIVTVPFGINNYFDHKKTYYLIELLNILEQYFNVNKVKFFGKWIGVVLRNNIRESNNDFLLQNTHTLLNQLENNFYTIERDYINKNNKVTKKLEIIKKEKDELVEKINQLENNFYTIERDYINKNNEVTKKLETVKKEKEELVEKLKLEVNEVNKLKEEVGKIKKMKEEKIIEKNERIENLNRILYSKANVYLEIIEKLGKLCDTLKNKEEELIITNKKVIEEKERINKDLINEKQRYLALSKSKLGKMTLNYWLIKRKIKCIIGRK